jgi:hypothetical protein
MLTHGYSSCIRKWAAEITDCSNIDQAMLAEDALADRSSLFMNSLGGFGGKWLAGHHRIDDSSGVGIRLVIKRLHPSIFDRRVS